MTLDELEQDADFFSGLSKGEFCLVLGAGFSATVKNMTDPESLKELGNVSYEDFKNIPVGEQYVSLTNKIFGSNVKAHQSAANTWKNHHFGLTIDDTQSLYLKPFIKSLFTVDENSFRVNSLAFYKNILIPPWHQVYTFNFDNVFETIVQQASRSDSFYSVYPPKTGLEKTSRTAVVHVHGSILGNEPQYLTFDTANYMTARGSEHSLYNPLYSDINNSKKLFIIGSRFDEEIIEDKLFKSLQDRNICIYRFAREDDDFATKPGIYNNPNYRFVKIKETSQVLDFLAKHKTRIENIAIEGVKLINDDFRKEIINIGERRKFTPTDFYLAKNDIDCQWYGICREEEWDVEREIYNDVLREAKKSFTEFRQSKIAAVVYGRGGSGKSTLLRRLALDLKNEEFIVLWVNDKQINNLFQYGLSKITNDYRHKKFLILIEDVYRIKQSIPNFREIINSICTNQNVRVVIGDRTIDYSTYGEHLYNSDENTYELKVEDNKSTLEKILDKIPVWKETAKFLLAALNDYQSSLYLILWTIGRTAEKKQGLDLNQVFETRDLAGHFRTIVESDLKAIKNMGYPGLAKMLYYWASIYAANKIYIGYDLFYALADLFKHPESTKSKIAIASTEIKPILDIYIYKAQGLIKNAGELPVVGFNHDILAEEGLAKAKLSDWHAYDQSIKLQMLPAIIEDGDTFSASNFLTICLTTIDEELFGREEKKNWVIRLMEKGNFGPYLLTIFATDYYTPEQKSQIAEKILSQPDFWKFFHPIIISALNYLSDHRLRDKAANEILSQHEFWKLHQDLVSKALNLSVNKSIKEQATSAILTQEDFWNLPKEVVSTALNVSPDQALKNTAANEILTQSDFWNLPKEIVSTALNVSADQTLKDKAANEIFSQSDFWNLPKEVVSTALNVTADQTLKNKAANEILSQPDCWKLPPDVVSTALNISDNQELKEKAANDILSQPDFWNFSQDMLAIAIKNSNNNALKENIAKNILEAANWRIYLTNLIFPCLYIYKAKENLPDFVINIIHSIIQECNTTKRGPFYYRQLMRIPFHTVKEWKKASKNNIAYWEKKPRNMVTYTILAYRSHPKEIKDMCSAILNSWRAEITKEVRRSFGPSSYGDHVRLSLSHPDLRKQAQLRALQMHLAEMETPGLLPAYLHKIVNQIVDEKQFPTWEV